MAEITREWVLVYEEGDEVKHKEFDSTELALQFVSLVEVKFVALMSKKYVQAMEETFNEAVEEAVKQTVVRTMQFFME